MRSFSLVLLRRLLFRPAPATNSNSNPTSPSIPSSFPRLTLYDHLSHQTLATLERLLLFSLSHEVSPHVRRKTVDTVCDLSNQGMVRGRPWHALQAQAFSMIQSQAPSSPLTQDGGAALRESAFRVFSGCPNLVMDLQTDAVLNVLGRGLQDQYSIEVRFIKYHRVTIRLVHLIFRFDTRLCWLQWHTFLQLRQLSFPNQHPCFLRCSTLFLPLLNLSPNLHSVPILLRDLLHVHPITITYPPSFLH